MCIRDRYKPQYGNVSSASVGAIQRGLLQIEEQGGDRFFGEPMLNIDDLMQTDDKGRGVVNILAADKLMNSPKLYATFLLWMLAELFEQLPEVGDPEKPKVVSAELPAKVFAGRPGPLGGEAEATAWAQAALVPLRLTPPPPSRPQTGHRRSRPSRPSRAAASGRGNGDRTARSGHGRYPPPG